LVGVPEAVRQLAPGDVFAGYRIEALAGRGGMGLVYKARQLRPERAVAVKVIMPGLAGDADFRARFEQEASLAAQIEHPNVIPIYEVGDEDGLLYIVMRFVESTDLRGLLRSRRRLTAGHAVRIVGQIAAALDAAHAHGLVHRDVKPANVLVTGAYPDEHLYLTDFGLTKRVTDVGGGMTATGGFVGTLDYIAPEQVRGDAVDGRVDVYALGCVLHELLTGQVPFPRDTEVAKIFAHLSADPPLAGEAVTGVPAELDAVVARAMAKDPGDRYASAGDLARAAVAAAARVPGSAVHDGADSQPSAVRDITQVTAAATRPKPDGPLPLPPFIAQVAVREFVGRDEVLAALHARWDDAGPAPRLVFVTGDAGMGKTSIAARFAHEVHAAGAAVLYGRCDEEPVSSYQPFVEALSQYLDHASVDALLADLPAEALELGRLIPRLGVRPDSATLGGSPDAADDRFRLFEAVCAVLRRLAGTRPVLLLVDDLHWADKATLSLLRHVMRSLTGSRLMVIGTFREVDAGEELLGLLAHLHREGGFEQLALSGFGIEEMFTLLATDTPARPRTGFVNAMITYTGGNPFYIDQILRSLGGGAAAVALTGPEIAALGVPPGVKEVILRRLAPLRKPAIDLLAVAAVAGQRFRLGVLEAVLGQEADRLLETLDELIAMSVVSEVPGEIDVFSFTHNLVRETQYEQLSASRRVRLHAAIGRTLEAAGTSPPAELAHHFFCARQLVGPEPSIAYSLDAARRASKSLAHEEAIEHYERALAALDEAAPDRRYAVLLELGDALERLHEIVPARERYLGAAGIARELGAPELLARAALGFAKWQRYGVVDREAIALLDEALAGLPPAAEVLRAETLALLASRLDPLEAQARRETLLDDALRIARGLDDPTTLDSILRTSAPVVLCRPESLERRLELADEALALHDRARNRESLARAQMHRFLALFELGRTTEAGAALDAYADSLAGLRQPWFEWSLLVLQAMLLILAGRIEEADVLRARANALEQASDPDAIESQALQGFLIAHGTGRFDAADEAALRRCATDYPGQPIWTATVARLLLGLGRVDEARAAFERCAAVELTDVAPTQDRLATLVLLAECAHGFADCDRAAALHSLLAPYAGRTATMETGWAAWGSISRPLGLLAHTMGAAPEAVAAHLERALVEDRERGAILWLAHGASAYRALLPDQLDRSADARALVEEAEALWSECEAGADAVSYATFPSPAP
jgi:predicted ATPase